jgi:hypothetical protein
MKYLPFILYTAGSLCFLAGTIASVVRAMSERSQ